MRFDAIAIVDWSAANRPRQGKDSIWIGLSGAGGERHWNPPTRHQARRDLASLIRATLDKGQRLLIGADFAFGYPQGFAQALTGRADPLAVWDWLDTHLQDDERNRSNRFHVAAQANRAFPGLGPFWFRPAALDLPDLPMKGRDRHGLTLSEFRESERRTTGAQSVWKLGGAGSVGSQALTGIPHLNALRRQFGKAVTVWPFQTEASPIVLAEVFPSLLAPAIARRIHPGAVRDAVQVTTLSQALWSLARRDAIAPLFEVPTIARTEGWILGLGFEERLTAAL